MSKTNYKILASVSVWMALDSGSEVNFKLTLQYVDGPFDHLQLAIFATMTLILIFPPSMLDSSTFPNSDNDKGFNGFVWLSAATLI